MFDDPVFQSALAAGAARHQAFEQRRATAGAVAERKGSRTAFADLGAAEALALAQRAFPDLMTDDLDALRLQSGDRVVGFERPNVAVVRNGDGDRELILSSAPAAADEGGELRSLDLDLVEQNGEFAAARAAVEVTLPQSAAGYTRLADVGVGVRPADVADVEGAVAENRIFFHDVTVDTDYVATPTRAGAEVMWQLRSVGAPQRLGLDVDLPAGASLRLSTALTAAHGSAATAGVEVVSDGAVIATLSAPVALDADGVSVPAEYRFVDGRLVVDVDHHGADVRYPVLVDPEVREVWGNSDFLPTSCGGGASDLAPGRWTYQHWVTPFTYRCGNVDSWGNGLFVISSPGYYGDTARGQWIWSPPLGAYIQSAWFDGIRHTAAGSHVYHGLYGQTWGALANQYFESTTGNYSHITNSPYNGWTAVLGLWMDGGWTRPHSAIGAVRGVNLRLGDLDPPTIALTSITGGTWGAGYPQHTKWTRDTTAHVTVRGHDGGLGVKHVAVVRDGSQQVIGGVLHNCIGHRSSPCPTTWDQGFDINLAALPDGVHSLQTRAIDIVDNPGYGPHWHQRIDRTSPTISLSGDMFEHATDGQMSLNPTIHVHASDGTTAPSRTPGSGVNRVRLMIDGYVIRDYDSQDTACDNCDRGLTWTLPGPLLDMHTVTVEAWDYVGNKAEYSFAAGLHLAYETSEVEYGPQEPATQAEAELDPSWDGGASAATPRGCKWLYNKDWWNAGRFKRALWVSLRSRYCWNRMARTVWSSGDWNIAREGKNLGGTISLQSIDLGDKPIYPVTHHGYPRGGVHMGVDWRPRICLPGFVEICHARPWRELVNYGYYDGNGFALRGSI